MKKGDLVTVTLEENNQASNTYVVYADLGEEVVLAHPLHDDCKIVRRKEDLNKVQPNIKDSTERAIDYAMRHESKLDHNMRGDLEAIRLYFLIHRTLTNHQKNSLASIGGLLASIYFHQDVQRAMDFVNKNKALLSPFNDMWYNNFKDLFYGRKPITSPKQRSSIFNIVGSVLAELERNEIPKDK